MSLTVYGSHLCIFKLSSSLSYFSISSINVEDVSSPVFPLCFNKQEFAIRNWYEYWRTFFHQYFYCFCNKQKFPIRSQYNFFYHTSMLTLRLSSLNMNPSLLARSINFLDSSINVEYVICGCFATSSSTASAVTASHRIKPRYRRD